MVNLGCVKYWESFYSDGVVVVVICQLTHFHFHDSIRSDLEDVEQKAFTGKHICCNLSFKIQEDLLLS